MEKTLRSNQTEKKTAVWNSDGRYWSMRVGDAELERIGGTLVGDVRSREGLEAFVERRHGVKSGGKWEWMGPEQKI